MMSDRPKSDRPKQGIELNTVQLVSSMAAAVTGAILTSYLGDGGTILGTAVGSGASTAGFAVYKHYLVRTKDKVAPVLVEHARQWTPTGTLATDQNPTRADAAGRAGGPSAPDATRVDRAVGYQNGNGHNGHGYGQRTTASDWEHARRTAPGWAEPTRADWGPDATQSDPRRTRQDQWSPDATRHDLPVTRQDPGLTRQDPGLTRQDAAPTPTARYGTVEMGTGATGGSGDPGGPGSGKHGRPGSGGLSGWLSGRPRWVLTLGSAAAVFVVAMIIITVVELGTGKPIDASVWGRHQTGTTLGGGHSTSATPSTTPSVTPSAPASGSTGATGPAQQSTPNPASSTAPTPSSVPSVGSTGGATAPASGGASPGGAGAANNATAVPGQ
jgi:hypothetical protein